MRSFSSLPTQEQQNSQKLLQQLQVSDPELFHFQMARFETAISPTVAEKIFREIANICEGTGYGKVCVHLNNGIITSIEGERKHKLEEEVKLSEGMYVTKEFFELKITGVES